MKAPKTIQIVGVAILFPDFTFRAFSKRIEYLKNFPQEENRSPCSLHDDSSNPFNRQRQSHQPRHIALTSINPHVIPSSQIPLRATAVSKHQPRQQQQSASCDSKQQQPTTQLNQFQFQFQCQCIIIVFDHQCWWWTDSATETRAAAAASEAADETSGSKAAAAAAVDR